MIDQTTVKVCILQHPADMVHHSCEAVIKEKNLSPTDLMWLLASYELQKPRVISRTITDTINTRDSVG